LAEANAKVYVNPAETIAICDSLLALTTLSSEIRIKVLLSIMTGYSSIRDHEKALEYGMIAEEFISDKISARSQLSIYHSIGSQYHALKMYNRAINYFDKAEILIRELPDPVDMALASGYNNLSRAFIYRDQMGCDVALVHFNKAIDDYMSIRREVALKNLSVAYYNKGNCEFFLQMVDSAEQSYLEAIAVAEANEAMSLAAFAQKGLAILFTSKGEYQLSLEILEDALKNSEGVGDPLLNQAIFKAIADNHMALGNWEQFEIYSMKTGEIQSGILKKQRSSIAAALDDLAENSAASIQSSKTKQLSWISLIAAGCLAAASFLVVLYRKGRRQRAELRNKIVGLQGDAHQQ
jgi:tetratricopeptide (TPR) repeat protein